MADDVRRQTFASVWDAIEDSPSEAANMRRRSELTIALQEIEPAEFFNKRAAGRTGEGLGRILDKVPDRLPEPGDELPESWAPGSLDGR